MKNVKIQKRYLGPDPDPKPPEGTPPKVLSEAEVNAIVQKRLGEEAKKATKEKADLLARIAVLEPDALKAAELQAQIDQLQREGKSQHELAEMDRKKERAALETLAKEKEADANKWRKRLEETQLERDLMDAASHKESDFVTAQQGVLLLRQGARIQPKLDGNGKPTEAMETRIKLQTVKDGKPIELDLTPMEAVKILKDDKSNFNFFNAGVKGGLGGSQSNTRTGVGGKLGLSQEEFSKRYAKGTLPKD